MKNTTYSQSAPNPEVFRETLRQFGSEKTDAEAKPVPEVVASDSSALLREAAEATLRQFGSKTANANSVE